MEVKSDVGEVKADAGEVKSFTSDAMQEKWKRADILRPIWHHCVN